jgi:hypothetical protein
MTVHTSSAADSASYRLKFENAALMQTFRCAVSVGTGCLQNSLCTIRYVNNHAKLLGQQTPKETTMNPLSKRQTPMPPRILHHSSKLPLLLLQSLRKPRLLQFSGINIRRRCSIRQLLLLVSPELAIYLRILSWTRRSLKLISSQPVSW